MNQSVPRLSLPARPESAAAARRFVGDTVAGWGLRDLREVAVLLVSELVTNSLLHAGTPIDVDCRLLEDTVRIGVHDGRTQSGARRAFPPDATTGRGLQIVESLADDWGVDVAADGKCTWFDLRLPARP